VTADQQAGPQGHGYAPDLLAGRVALVSAAGGAICGAAACMLASVGANLVLTDINAQRLGQVAADAREQGGQVVEFPADLTDRKQVVELLDLVRTRFGGADILINGLGEHLASVGAFEDTSEEQWQDLYEINLLHVLRLTQRVVPWMKHRGWGRIVNFSSVEGIRAAPDLAVYAAFKRAIDGFTRSLAVELAPSGIGVNALAVDKTRSYQVGHYVLPPEFAPFVPTWIPAGHYADPAEVARIVLFLVSPMNTWIVGETVAADGGTLAAGGWYRTPERWTNQPLLTQYLEPPAINATRPPSVR